MSSYNRVILMGNLTRDPEMKFTPNQMAITTFGMATNKRWKSPDGQDRNEACYVDIKAWGKQAEAINQYCHKGDALLVEGRLTFESWEAKDGTKRNRLVVTLDKFEFMSSPKQQATPESHSEKQEELPLDDDPPF